MASVYIQKAQEILLIKLPTRAYMLLQIEKKKEQLYWKEELDSWDAMSLLEMLSKMQAEKEAAWQS